MAKQPDLDEIASDFGCYPVEAYILVGEGLRHASRRLGRERTKGADRHLTAAELIDGILDLAVERYGLLAPQVMGNWGVQQSEDMGAITFHLIERGVLGKQPGDSQEEFANGPAFDEAVRKRVRQQLIGPNNG